jgi:hypothetical protein
MLDALFVRLKQFSIPSFIIYAPSQSLWLPEQTPFSLSFMIKKTEHGSENSKAEIPKARIT